jgi:hypothetical protein
MMRKRFRRRGYVRDKLVSVRWRLISGIVALAAAVAVTLPAAASKANAVGRVAEIWPNTPTQPAGDIWPNAPTQVAGDIWPNSPRATDPN